MCFYLLRYYGEYQSGNTCNNTKQKAFRNNTNNVYQRIINFLQYSLQSRVRQSFKIHKDCNNSTITTIMIHLNTPTIMTVYCLSVSAPASQVPNHKIYKELQYNKKVG